MLQAFTVKKVMTSYLIVGLFLSWSCFAMPEMYVTNLDHQRIPLSSMKGSWVFINYWASWCEPCVEEIKQFNRLYAQSGTDRIQVFGVNQDGGSIDSQIKLSQKFGLSYPSLDPHSLQDLHLRALSVVPVTYILNPAGKLHTILYGGQTLKDFNVAMKAAPDI